MNLVSSVDLPSMLTRGKLSYPLCVFADLPTLDLEIADIQGFFSWFHATATFIHSIPAEQLRVGLKANGSDAVLACVNSMVIRKSVDNTLVLWRSAYHRIVATLLVDNRAARSLGTILKVRILMTALFSSITYLHSGLISRQWIFLEAIGCVSGKPDIQRLANIGHGYVETVS